MDEQSMISYCQVVKILYWSSTRHQHQSYKYGPQHPTFSFLAILDYVGRHRLTFVMSFNCVLFDLSLIFPAGLSMLKPDWRNHGFLCSHSATTQCHELLPSWSSSWSQHWLWAGVWVGTDHCQRDHAATMTLLCSGLSLHASPHKHLKLFVIMRNCCWQCCCGLAVTNGGAGTAPDLCSLVTSRDTALHVNTSLQTQETWQPLSSKMKMDSSYQGRLPIHAWSQPLEETCTGS